jgi:hypothetical protein
MAARRDLLEFENVLNRRPYDDPGPALTNGLARSATRQICASGAFIKQSGVVFNVKVAAPFYPRPGADGILSQIEGLALIVKNL